jgi:hypothetical protein
MVSEKDISIILGSVMGTLAFIALVFLAYYYSNTLFSKIFRFNYNVVDHGLDEEEIEFKKIIEMQSDDIEELFDIPDDELDFDVRERDRLSMIETYRQNLVAAANGDGGGGNNDSNGCIDEDSLRL